MGNRSLSSPIQEIPISDDEMLLVGRISLVWAQLDFLVENILCRLGQFDVDLLNYYFGNKTIAPKLDAIEFYARRCDHKTKQALDEVVSSTRACNAERNLMAHGKWGWHWDETVGCWRSGAYDVGKKRWFYTHQLNDLHERMVLACSYADVAFYLIGPERTSPPANKNRPFFVSAVDPTLVRVPRPFFER